MKWVADYEAALFAFLRKEMATSPERWHATLRVVFATTLSMFITQTFHLSEGYWSIISIMIICSPSVDSSVLKMMQRLMGTIAGVAVAYIITAVFYQQFWFYVAAFYVAIVLAGLVIARSEQPYVGWVFALSILIVAWDSKTGFDRIGGICFQRFWIVAIGVITSWIALALIYPAKPIRDFRKKYIIAVKVEIERTKWIIARLRAVDQPIVALPPRSLDPLDAQKLFVYLANGAFSNLDVRGDLAQLTDRVTLISAIGSITSNTIALTKQLNDTSVDRALLEPTAELMNALTGILGQLADWVQSPIDLVTSLQSNPIDFEPLRLAIDSFAQAHEVRIDQLGIRDGTGRSPAINQAFMATISMCRAFHTTYSSAQIENGTSVSGAGAKRSEVLRMISTPLLAPGLRDDAQRSFWFSIKLATACVIGLIFVTATQFPSLGTMLVTPLTVVGATGGSSEGTRARARLRLIGTIVGGLVSVFAIIFLIPTVDSSPGLLLIWIGCSAPLAWIMTGGPNISYLGVQAIFCLAIAIGTSFQPTIDLSPPSARIVGVFLGTLVTLALFNWFRPDFARNELMRIFALTLERVSKISTLGFPSNPGTSTDLTHLRYKLLSLILRSRTLGQTLQREPRASEPTISKEQVAEITDHLTLIVYNNNALALNRITARLTPETMFSDLEELHACAESIRSTCIVGCDAMESGEYSEFALRAQQLEAESHALEQLIPTIRMRPRIRAMNAASSEFILGQVGMYRVASMRLFELSNVLNRIASERAQFRSAKQPFRPSAPSVVTA